jgi:hypothetical protein
VGENRSEVGQPGAIVRCRFLGHDQSLAKPHNDKDKLPGPPATPSFRAKPVWRPRSASSV